MFKKLKEKMQASTSSATMGVAGGIVGLGVLMASSDQFRDLIMALVPMDYQGVTLAGLGLIVAIARLRTLKKPE